MTDKLIFDITGLDDEELEDFIQENLEEFYPAMELNEGAFGSRTQIDSVEIETLSIDGNTVTIEYRTEFSAYYGCDDMNKSDEDFHTVVAQREGNKLIFDVLPNLEERSTADEF